ncbi:hypothetical protein [Baekduia sp. Peel2402]|uniref:hypothetical protein n=1 Tax=Baekduia sp. Peel2402 TaxID=3458296 RepID=UPI00403EE78B
MDLTRRPLAVAAATGLIALSGAGAAYACGGSGSDTAGTYPGQTDTAASYPSDTTTTTSTTATSAAKKKAATRHRTKHAKRS